MPAVDEWLDQLCTITANEIELLDQEITIKETVILLQTLAITGPEAREVFLDQNITVMAAAYKTIPQQIGIIDPGTPEEVNLDQEITINTPTDTFLDQECTIRSHVASLIVQEVSIVQ